MKKLLILLITMIFPLVICAEEIDGINYELDSNEKTACVIKGSYSGDIKIPSEIIFDGKNYKVTKIGYEAFCKCTDLTSIELPSSLITIDQRAFYDCGSLTSIEISKGVTTIDEFAFSWCTGLLSVTIPESVDFIHETAFQNCLNLRDVNIDCHYLGSCFKDLIDIKNLKFGPHVEEIGEMAFMNCFRVSNIDFGTNVKKIGRLAFFRCEGVSSLTLPNSISTIEVSAFAMCKNLESVVLPENIKLLKDYVFQGTNLKHLSIPSSVTTIYQYAFKDCNNLEDVTSLPENPPLMYDKSFGSYDITLYVPESSVDQYKATSPWNLFKEILIIEGGTSIANVQSQGAHIKSCDGMLSIQGVSEGMPITVYTLGGKQVGTGITRHGETIIATTLQPNDIAVVKIGEKSMKIVIK